MRILLTVVSMDSNGGAGVVERNRWLARYLAEQGHVVTGTPVLLTDRCGFGSVARVGGGLVVAASVEGLASGLRRTPWARHSLPSWVESLRRHVQDDYGWPSVVAGLVSHLRTITRQRPARGRGRVQMPGRVSLVIPAYNAESYVAETIESALAQDYPELEVIAVDDGSTDSTGEVLARYANRIVVHHQPNAGQSAAMAAGWKLGGGDLFGYLSADDRLRPHAVRRAVEALRSRPEVVLVYPDFDVIDARSQRLFTVRAPDFSRRSLFADFTCLPGPGALFRRSAYEQVGSWRTDLGQIPDMDFYLRLGLYGDFRRIPEVLADFRMHEGSTTYSPAPYHYGEEPMTVVDSLFARALLPADVIRWRRRMRASAHLLSASVHARAGRGWPAAKHVVASAAAPSAQTPKKTFSVVKNYLEWQRAQRRQRHRDLDAVG